VSLKRATDEELKAELERRQTLRSQRPKPLPNPDLTDLIKVLEEGITVRSARGDYPKDHDHWIYEAAVRAIYGEAYWDWAKAQG